MAGTRDDEEGFFDEEVEEENEGGELNSDDEDDEDEEAQDEYENDGFIVDNVDEEEEDPDRVDSETDRQKKKKRKKKRELEKNYVLDDDDYALLLDNNVSGIHRPNLGSKKFKRLKKARTVSEEEHNGFSNDDLFATAGKGGISAEERLKRSLFDDGLEDNAEEEQPQVEEDTDSGEDEMRDFIVEDPDSPRRKVINKDTRKALGVSSAAMQLAHDFFGDVDSTLEYRKQQLARMSRSNEFGERSRTRLEDEVESLDLLERYMTKKDEQIRAVDVPERIQLSEEITGPPPTDGESIVEESNWILKQLVTEVLPTLCKICPETIEIESDLHIDKGDIMRFLEFIHLQKLDVPFIAMYKKDYCLSLFKNSDKHEADKENKEPTLCWHKLLWAILDLDKKWLLLQKRKTGLHLYYNKRIKADSRNTCEETRINMIQHYNSIINSLQAAETAWEIDDVESKFNLHFPPDEFVTGEGQRKQPKRKSLYNVCSKAGIGKVAAKFGYTSEQFGSLISLSLEEMRRDPLVDGKETPEDVASNYICAMFETPQSVLKGARHMAAVEISREPSVRKHVRSIFMDNAVVSTRPTADGRVAVDSDHQLATVKWLKDKPLTKFEDAQWLLIQQAEEKKIIEVFLKLPESISDKLISDCSEYYLSDGVSTIAKLWNKQREEILKDAFHNFLLPLMKKEARALLTTRAKNWVLMEYGKLLWDKVSIAPYGKQEDITSSHAWEGAPRVMACCWGPGKPPNTFVMLDSAGEVVDVLYAGFLSIRARSADDEQRKINDQQRLLKFMNDHGPHVVVLGAVNLSCSRLKEDIYEIIFKMIEHHPRDVGHEMDSLNIVYGDESLPQLYEKSRVSGDQLPKQSGIIRRAVALGRYLQNPLAMVATLCGPQKEILSWKLGPLESYLTPEEKYEMVEQVMVDVTNQVGIDINLAASHEWLCAPLQFISGLGPRKAASLQRSLVRAGRVLNRKELFHRLYKKVFVNAAGFLRVCQSGKATDLHEIDLLDDTRIHPENYKDAMEFCKKVYHAADQDYATDDEDILEMARENSEPLKVLIIDQYATSNECADKKNTLDQIRLELIQGFRDWRRPYATPTQDEEFCMITGETNETLAEGRIVQVTVRMVQSHRAKCILESGLTGFLNKEDYDDGCRDTDLTEKLKEGDILTCKVKLIQKNRYLVNLSCRENDLNGFHSETQVLDAYYCENWSTPREKITTPRQKDQARECFKARMITHPYFQNISVDNAIQLLLNKDPGESIIRPSSRGPYYLSLTLKVYEGVYAHKEIIESGKDGKNVTSLLRLGKTLKIDEDEFEDLDEVKDRYIDPLVVNLKAMLNYRKFREGTKAEVDDILRSEKIKNPMRIVYSFGIWHEHPGVFILTYIRNTNPHHEYVGIHPKGFKFRKKMFKDIDHLVAYFQRHIDDQRDMTQSIRSVAAMVPMQSPAYRSFNSRDGPPVDQNRVTSTPGFTAGDHGNGGKQDALRSCLSSGGNDNGWRNFPGFKVQNSPGRIAFPGAWGDGTGDDGSGPAGGWFGTGGGSNERGWAHCAGSRALAGPDIGTARGWGAVGGKGSLSGSLGSSGAISWGCGPGGPGSGANHWGGGRGGDRRGGHRGGRGRDYGGYGTGSSTWSGSGDVGGWSVGNGNVRGGRGSAGSGWGDNGGRGWGHGSGRGKDGGQGAGGWGSMRGVGSDDGRPREGGGGIGGGWGSKDVGDGSGGQGASSGDGGWGSWGSKVDGGGKDGGDSGGCDGGWGSWVDGGDKDGGGNGGGWGGKGASSGNGGWGNNVGGDGKDGSKSGGGWGQKGGGNDGWSAGSGGDGSGWGKWS